jgi:hypothetical protein
MTYPANKLRIPARPETKAEVLVKSDGTDGKE